MKTFSRLLLLCFGVILFAPAVHARRKHHTAQSTPAADLSTPSPEPPSLPAEAAPRISPDAPPSVSLQPFVDTHLGKILVPLGTSAFAQPEVIASVAASYADGMAAAPATHKPAYQAAQDVCRAMAGAMSERQNAVAALRGALATRSSEAEQPRGGGEAVNNARAEDNFFLDSQKNNWIQRATVLRNNITALYLREREIERQVGVWSPPPPPPVAAPSVAAPLVAAPTPSVSVPPPATTAANDWSHGDPVLGDWTWEGSQIVRLQADHTIDGMRHGTWWNASTAAGRRDYEVHWEKHGVSNYMVLSEDGRLLDGKDGRGGHVTAERR